jgi:hypothetical protein
MQQITVFIDLKDQLNMFQTNICPSSGANYSMWYGILLWWVGGQEGGSVVLCAWCEGRNVTNDTAQFPTRPESSEIPLLERQKSQSALYMDKIMGINWGWGRLCLSYVSFCKI